MFGTWSFSRLDLVVAVDNLFNVPWNEAQFATTSRLRDEPAEVTELHFTPGYTAVSRWEAEYRF